MKLAQIEQYDLIGALRRAIAGRRRARRATEIRDHATAMIFANLAEQHRLDERRKRAERIFEVVFGAEFADMKPWQRQVAYDCLKARDDGRYPAIIAAMPLRPF